MEKHPTPRLMRLGDLLCEWQTEAEAAHEAYTTGKARGPVTALPRVDEAIGGFLPPGVHVLHGAPGAGKTAFALQVAATCGCPALYVTCEMSPLELLRRIAARVTGTYLGRFKTGELTPGAAMDAARRAVAAAPDLAILDATTAYAHKGEVLDAAAATRGDGRDVLIVMDSLHAWSDAAVDDDGHPVILAEYDALNAHLTALRHIAATLQCPALAVSERNRQSMGKGGLSAGAGTRKLEYRGETVFDLDREEDAREDLHGEVPVTLRLPKNRNGAQGKTVALRFHGAKQAFREDG